MNNPKVSIIILNWNGWKDTIECLESLKKIDYSNYEIIVVDNGSSGNDVNILRKKFGDYIRIIKNYKNYGFAKGNNIVIKKVFKENKSDYILLLNNDTVVKKTFLNELINVAENDKGIGLLSPIILYYDYKGKKDIIWFGGGKINWKKFPIYHHKYKRLKLKQIKNNLIQSNWVSGAALLMRVKHKLLLNDKFFFGGEDIDLSLKSRKKGYKNVVVKKSIVWHKISKSRKEMNSLKKILNHLKTNLKLIKIYKKNYVFYFGIYLFNLIKFILLNIIGYKKRGFYLLFLILI